MPSDKNDLVEWVISCDSNRYRYITQELISFLNWLKRFAEGMIEDKDKDKEETRGGEE
jgi:CRISPR-associated protein Cmr5